MEGFLLTAAQAEEFFRRCVKQKAVTLEDKIKIMDQMVAERRAFPQTEEQLAKRLKDKKVLRIKPNDRPNS